MMAMPIFRHSAAAFTSYEWVNIRLKSLYKILDMITSESGPIGIFDSGYGGLTILKEIRRTLPAYDYIYLGDNARAPYGTRSFDVLGVIRPTVEQLGVLSKSGHIGIFATPGTIQSESYNMEIAKLYPGFVTVGHACPMWVPLIENGEADRPGADYFVKQEVDRLLAKDSDIDTIILACTHYPLLRNKIRQYVPEGIRLVTQGEIVAESLASYLTDNTGRCEFITTENSIKFSQMASLFLGRPVTATSIEI